MSKSKTRENSSLSCFVLEWTWCMFIMILQNPHVSGKTLNAGVENICLVAVNIKARWLSYVFYSSFGDLGLFSRLQHFVIVRYAFFQVLIQSVQTLNICFTQWWEFSGFQWPSNCSKFLHLYEVGFHTEEDHTWKTYSHFWWESLLNFEMFCPVCHTSCSLSRLYFL